MFLKKCLDVEDGKAHTIYMTTTTHSLCSGYEFSETVMAHTFDHMYALARPILEFHGGDLFHDATWLRKNLEPGRPFYFGIRSSGTDTTRTKEFALVSNDVVYEFKLYDRGHLNWKLDITEVTA